MTAPLFNNSRWEVMWVVTKNGEKRIICKEFDHDYASALELYVKVKLAGKKLATLRCCNVGWAPPERFRDAMAAYNRQGVWWCPYCIQLRRFEKRAWDEVEGMTFASEPKYFCPMCDISNTDARVIQYNPIAYRIHNGKRSRGRGKKVKGGRRKR